VLARTVGSALAPVGATAPFIAGRGVCAAPRLRLEGFPALMPQYGGRTLVCVCDGADAVGPPGKTVGWTAGRVGNLRVARGTSRGMRRSDRGSRARLGRRVRRRRRGAARAVVLWSAARRRSATHPQRSTV
jgi:hypothetical protein